MTYVMFCIYWPRTCWHSQKGDKEIRVVRPRRNGISALRTLMTPASIVLSPFSKWTGESGFWKSLGRDFPDPVANFPISQHDIRVGGLVCLNNRFRLANLMARFHVISNLSAGNKKWGMCRIVKSLQMHDATLGLLWHEPCDLSKQQIVVVNFHLCILSYDWYVIPFQTAWAKTRQYNNCWWPALNAEDQPGWRCPVHLNLSIYGLDWDIFYVTFEAVSSGAHVSVPLMPAVRKAAQQT